VGVREIKRKKTLGFIALLLILLIVPLAYSSGLLNMVGNLFSSNAGGSSAGTLSSATVFVDPFRVIDESLQSGSKFTVHVNVSGVTDLFSWQIKLGWNSSILSLSRIIQNEFLNRTTSANKTSSSPRYYGGLNFVMNVTDNAHGNTSMVESILGDVSGINGNGRMVSVEFLVVGYGCTNLSINLTGNLATTLLNSTGGAIEFTKTDGYFRNKFAGDADGDKHINIFDILEVQDHWYPGPPLGPGGYDRNVDLDDDTNINIFDILVVQENWE